MQLLDVNFCAEFDYMPKCDDFICIPHEESFGYKRSIFIEYLRFEKSVEVSTLLRPVFASITTFKVIWIGVVYFFFILIEDLKLHEVDALLEKVYVAELLNM